jgi:hypothetical protein
MKRAHFLPAVAALLLAACSDPYSATPTSTPTSVATPSGELPGRIPSADRNTLAEPLSRPATTADAALRRFAALTTNWTGETAFQRYLAAARAAVGQARRDAQQVATTMRGDPELKGTASTSTIAGIVPQDSGWSLVITREQLSPDAGPERYRVYRGHTQRVSGGYEVDAWEAQP